jgi:molybdopterin-synthase adenylyltransferase
MSGLRLVSPGYDALATAMLEAREVESCGVGYAHHDPATSTWIVAHAEPVPDAAYDRRDAVSATLKAAFLVDIANRARASDLSAIFAHTHPFANGSPVFSPTDDAGEAAIKAYMDRRAPSGRHLALVLGPQGCRARVLGTRLEVPVWEVGPTLRLWSDESAGQIDALRHDRQVRAFGAPGQHRVATLRIVVVGAGGTGSASLQQLAHLGISDVTIVDPDIVEATNLNRLIGSTPDDIGRPKVLVAERMVRAINPAIRVNAIQGDIVDAHVAALITGHDFAFLCTDSHASRAVVGQIAYQYLVPTIDMGVSITVKDGAVSHVTGRVQMLAPELTCLTCTQALDGEQIRRELLTPDQRAADPYVHGVHEPQPAVVSINSTVASLATTMFLGAVTPVPAQARFQLYDGIRGTVRPTVATAAANCIVCSRAGALAQGGRWPLPVRSREMGDG